MLQQRRIEISYHKFPENFRGNFRKFPNSQPWLSSSSSSVVVVAAAAVYSSPSETRGTHRVQTHAVLLLTLTLTEEKFNGSHTRTECYKDDCESLWKSLKLDPSPRKNGLTDRPQNLHRWLGPGYLPSAKFCADRSDVDFSPHMGEI